MASTFLFCSCGCGGALHPAPARTVWPASHASGPVAEPLTLAEAKLHLKVEHAVDDALIDGLIRAARVHAENVCELVLGAQTWRVTVDGFSSAWPIPLRRGPVTDLDTVQLIGADGWTVVVSDALLDRDSSPARVLPPTAGWPLPDGAPWMRTRVEYHAGLDTLPDPVRQAMLLLIGQWYDSRAAIHIGSAAMPLPNAVSALLAPYVVSSGVVGP